MTPKWVKLMLNLSQNSQRNSGVGQSDPGMGQGPRPGSIRVNSYLGASRKCAQCIIADKLGTNLLQLMTLAFLRYGGHYRSALFGLGDTDNFTQTK